MTDYGDTIRSTTATMDDIADLIKVGSVIWGGTSGGSANAQTLTTSPTFTTYRTGDSFRFTAGFTNTAACTINVNSAGAKNIYNYKTVAALNTNQITSGRIYDIVYDGTQFILMNPSEDWIVYSPSLSGSAISFTGQSNVLAEYMISGRSVYLKASIDMTITVTGAYFRMSVPINQAVGRFSGGVSVFENSTIKAGAVTYGSGLTIDIYKNDGGNWATVASGFTISGFYRLS